MGSGFSHTEVKVCKYGCVTWLRSLMDMHATITPGAHDYSILFSMIVTNLDFRLILRNFLLSEFSADNLEFYLAVQALREMMHGDLADTELISQQILDAFNMILTTFILVGAVMEINIEQRLRKKIMRLRRKIYCPISIIFNRAEIDATLQEAQREVRTIMGGCLSRFPSSLIFDQYVSQTTTKVLRLSIAIRSISLKQSTILVIESDDATGKLICKKLRDLTRCETMLVLTLHEADAALASNIFTAIVINIDLERGTDREEVRNELSSDSSTSELPAIWPINTVVVATLNKPNVMVQAECIQSGVSAVLIKPYQVSDLVDIIFPASLSLLLRRASLV